MLRRLKQFFCNHKFDYADLHKTGNTEDEDKRIQWKCWKCGRLFMRHCGLEVIMEYGDVVANPSTSPTELAE